MQSQRSFSQEAIRKCAHSSSRFSTVGKCHSLNENMVVPIPNEMNNISIISKERRKKSIAMEKKNFAEPTMPRNCGSLRRRWWFSRQSRKSQTRNHVSFAMDFSDSCLSISSLMLACNWQVWSLHWSAIAMATLIYVVFVVLRADRVLRNFLIADQPKCSIDATSSSEWSICEWCVSRRNAFGRNPCVTQRVIVTDSSIWRSLADRSLVHLPTFSFTAPRALSQNGTIKTNLTVLDTRTVFHQLPGPDRTPFDRISVNCFANSLHFRWRSLLQSDQTMAEFN